jgi:hypothetical protein
MAKAATKDAQIGGDGDMQSTNLNNQEGRTTARSRNPILDAFEHGFRLGGGGQRTTASSGKGLSKSGSGKARGRRKPGGAQQGATT